MTGQNPQYTFIEEDNWGDDPPSVDTTALLEHFTLKTDMLMKAIQRNREEIRRTRAVLLELVQQQHEEQMKQLKACQEAFQLNVERDEELREALAESGDPWDG